MGDLQDRLALAPFVLPVLLLAFALHEMAHAFTADRFGDRTPREHGRITLNPIRHLDPIGTLMLVVTYFLFFPIGFAVTPIDDERMRRPLLHGALTALAGPAMNFLLLLGFLALLAWGDAAGSDERILKVASYGVVFNALLVAFNLLPIPPLDGSRVVGSLINDRHLRRKWRELDQYGILFLLAIFLLLGATFQPFLDMLIDVVIGLAAGLIGVDPELLQ